MKKYLSGLRFGMLLQLAVGPMCLMVFNTAKDSGLLNALSLVLSIALVDAFYITLAGFGVSKILKNRKVSIIFKFVGSLVLVLFGLNIILGVFDIHIIPGLNVKPTTSSLFIQGLVLTLSSPMTIVFWGSILTSKIVEEKFKTKELIAFSIGLVSATLIFLSFVAVIGTFISSFIPEMVSKLLNIIVGAVIVFFGIRLLFKGDEKKMEFKKYEDIKEFANDTLDLLCKKEWLNNLMVGNIEYGLENGIEDDWILATVKENNKIELIMLLRRPWHLVMYSPTDNKSEDLYKYAAEQIYNIEKNLPGVNTEKNVAHIFSKYYCQLANIDPKKEVPMRILLIEKLEEQKVRDNANFREANLEDKPTLKKFIYDFHKEALHEELSDEKLEAEFNKYYAEENNCYFVLEKDGKIVSQTVSSRRLKKGKCVSRCIYSARRKRKRICLYSCVFGNKKIFR